MRSTRVFSSSRSFRHFTRLPPSRRGAPASAGGGAFLGFAPDQAAIQGVRSVAAETLGGLPDACSAQALFAAPRDEDHETREAASALNQLGSVPRWVQIADMLRTSLHAAGPGVPVDGDEAERLQLTIDVPAEQDGRPCYRRRWRFPAAKLDACRAPGARRSRSRLAPRGRAKSVQR